MLLNIDLLAIAQPTFELSRDSYSDVKITNFEYSADKDNRIQANNIFSERAGNYFKPFVENEFNFTDNVDTYWVKFNLHNANEHEGTWLLKFNDWTNVNFYFKNPDGIIGFKKTGHLVPLPERSYVSGDNNLISLTLKSDAKIECFVQLIKSDDYTLQPLDLTFSIFDKNSYFVSDSEQDSIMAFFTGIFLVILLYNLLILVSTNDRSYRLYLAFVGFNLLAIILNFGYLHEMLADVVTNMNIYSKTEVILSSFYGFIILLFTNRFLRVREYFPGMFKGIVAILIALVLVIIPAFFGQSFLATSISGLLGLITLTFTFIIAIRSYIRKTPSAGYFLLAQGSFIVGLMVFLLKNFDLLPHNNLTLYSAQIGSSIEAILFSMALGNRINLLQEDNNKKQADLIVQLKENELLQTKVNRELEDKVEERTAALKEAQNKLVQQEKLAALGQITAGIAHEIKNPLNFVNNFSELSYELIEELDSETNPKEKDEINLLLKSYMKKINEYGKRADKVVNSMLMHSYSGGAVRNEANINVICDEAVNLITNSLRPRYRHLNCIISKHYISNIPSIRINNHDILKVILGIISNAYYAIYEKSQINPGFKPEITITTRLNSGAENKSKSISVIISDNGNGMSEETKTKIFQPFFTNKPTGEGTGLALSISYDIVVAHDGDILFVSELNKGTTFEVILPVN